MLFQILLLDNVFSLDSVITAVGMGNNIPIMVAAMIISLIITTQYFQPGRRDFDSSLRKQVT